MPDDTLDLTDRIKEVAQGSTQASDAAGGMQQHSPKNLIEVDKYLAQKRAAQRKLGGLRIFKFRPPRGLPDGRNPRRLRAADAAGVGRVRRLRSCEPPRLRPLPKVRGRYDTADNARHWRRADGLSADAANSPGVGRILRNRARHEIFNNSYLRGMTRTLANDVISSGPRLQIQHADKNVAAQVEALWTQWSMKVRLGPKLRTMRLAQCVVGCIHTTYCG
jgi:hypothetical protein